MATRWASCVGSPRPSVGVQNRWRTHARRPSLPCSSLGSFLFFLFSSTPSCVCVCVRVFACVCVCECVRVGNGDADASEERAGAAPLPHRQARRLHRIRFQSARRQGAPGSVHRQSGRRLAGAGGRPLARRSHRRSQRRQHRQRKPQTGTRRHRPAARFTVHRPSVSLVLFYFFPAECVCVCVCVCVFCFHCC